MEEQKHTLDLEYLERLNKLGREHLNSHAIKGIIIRQDIEALINQSELCQQSVAELTKESERLGNIVHETNRLMSENQGLTEQVEDANKRMANQIAINSHIATELDRLREREKELVEALREVLTYWNMTVAPRPPHPYYTFVSRVKSLLSKFEVPNV